LREAVLTGYQERSGNEEAVAGVMLAYPAIERRLIILRRALGVFIHPFIEGRLQRIDIPSGKFATNLGYGPVGERPDNGAQERQVLRAGRFTRLRGK
jgi:hypothetical protein